MQLFWSAATRDIPLRPQSLPKSCPMLRLLKVGAYRRELLLAVRSSLPRGQIEDFDASDDSTYETGTGSDVERSNAIKFHATSTAGHMMEALIRVSKRLFEAWCQYTRLRNLTCICATNGFCSSARLPTKYTRPSPYVATQHCSPRMTGSAKLPPYMNIVICSVIVCPR